MVRIYLDTCVWSRPFDSQSNARIIKETEAFFEIAWKTDAGELEIVGSDVLFAELEDIEDEEKRSKIFLLAKKGISNSVKLGDDIRDTALEIEKVCRSYGPDSLHVASAIFGKAVFFVTTDDNLLKKKDCIKQKFKIDVINPINFVRDSYG